jgi:hypothetical protein
MALQPKRMGALVLRLLVGLARLGWPRVGSAQESCLRLGGAVVYCD